MAEQKNTPDAAGGRESRPLSDPAAREANRATVDAGANRGGNEPDAGGRGGIPRDEDPRE